MVEYLSGGRIQGSSTLTTSPAQTSWKEIGRATLSSNGHTISVTGLTAKDNIMFLSHQITTGSGRIDGHGTLNGDTGNNYAKRENDNGGSDNVAGSQATFSTGKGNGAAADNFVIGDILNVASKEKLIITHATGGCATGAGNVPSRREAVNKWVNTSDAVSSIQVISGYAGSSDFATGSELVVLGFDNDEADSGTNFWQELSSVELSSGADTITTGATSAISKKYLYVKAVLIADGNIRTDVRLNNDSGNNYTRRRSNNGASDSTATGESSIDVLGDSTHDKVVELFIVNKADKEKLILGNICYYNSADSAPQRSEFTAKWANTSDLISRITVNNTGASGDYASGSYIKVWGAD
jgi:hypothetical protein